MNQSIVGSKKTPFWFKNNHKSDEIILNPPTTHILIWPSTWSSKHWDFTTTFAHLGNIRNRTSKWWKEPPLHMSFSGPPSRTTEKIWKVWPTRIWLECLSPSFNLREDKWAPSLTRSGSVLSILVSWWGPCDGLKGPILPVTTFRDKTGLRVYTYFLESFLSVRTSPSLMCGTTNVVAIWFTGGLQAKSLDQSSTFPQFCFVDAYC